LEEVPGVLGLVFACFEHIEGVPQLMIPGPKGQRFAFVAIEWWRSLKIVDER
jgi:hypothetical protein